MHRRKGIEQGFQERPTLLTPDFRFSLVIEPKFSLIIAFMILLLREGEREREKRSKVTLEVRGLSFDFNYSIM